MTFNLWTFLFEVLNFLVLAYVLQRLLYRPLREAVEKRQQETARARTDADKARQEAEALLQQVHEQQARQEQDRQKLLREAHQLAEAERKRLLAEAERTVRERQEEARKALDREREEALRALRSEITDLALDLTRRLLTGAAERTLQNQLRCRLIETLHTLPEAERAQLVNHWQPQDGVVLETAEELDGTALSEVADAVTTVLNRQVTLTVSVRPELIGGVRLRLGGQLWDASLAGQLDHSYPSAMTEDSSSDHPPSK